MVLFLPMEQDLDCISGRGQILGKIKFDGYKDEYIFHPDNEETVLSDIEVTMIAEKIAGLVSGRYSMSMQDDD